MGTDDRSDSGRNQGFTLLELLIAIFLFGVVLTALAGVFISSARSIGDQRLRTAATRVAVDHVEGLRASPFDEIADEAPTTVTTAEGRHFTLATKVTRIDADTGQADESGGVKQIVVTITWSSDAKTRTVTYTTAIAASDPEEVHGSQSIGTIGMFPSPAVTDASGRPVADIEVTVPLEGFPASTLVHLSWSNANGTSGAATLTSTSGLNWKGTIPKTQIIGAIGPDGRGEVQFEVSAGTLDAPYTLALQRTAVSPPAITSATIDRNPVTVSKPTGNKTCNDRNQCQNLVDITFTVTATGLDPAQDSVILKFQLWDGTFQEVPLTPVGGQWQVVIRSRSTKFLTGTARPFRFSATRTSDGAAASTTVTRDVVAS